MPPHIWPIVSCPPMWPIVSCTVILAVGACGSCAPALGACALAMLLTSRKADAISISCAFMVSLHSLRFIQTLNSEAEEELRCRQVRAFGQRFIREAQSADIVRRP